MKEYITNSGHRIVRKNGDWSVGGRKVSPKEVKQIVKRCGGMSEARRNSELVVNNARLRDQQMRRNAR